MNAIAQPVNKSASCNPKFLHFVYLTRHSSRPCAGSGEAREVNDESGSFTESARRPPVKRHRETATQLSLVRHEV
jgi:hypothetical protein